MKSQSSILKMKYFDEIPDFFFSWTFRYKLLFWIQLKTLVSVIVFQNSFCTISLDMMMFWCLQSKVWLNMKTIKVFSGQYGFTRIYGSFKIQDLRNLLVKREKNPNIFAIFCHVIGIWYCYLKHGTGSFRLMRMSLLRFFKTFQIS